MTLKHPSTSSALVLRQFAPCWYQTASWQSDPSLPSQCWILGRRSSSAPGLSGMMWIQLRQANQPRPYPTHHSRKPALRIGCLSVGIHSPLSGLSTIWVSAYSLEKENKVLCAFDLCLHPTRIEDEKSKTWAEQDEVINKLTAGWNPAGHLTESISLVIDPSVLKCAWQNARQLSAFAREPLTRPAHAAGSRQK